MKSFVIVILYVLLGNYLIFAQTKNSYSYELQYLNGKVLPIYNNFPSSTGVKSVEGKFGVQLNGGKYWHQFFHYPKLIFNTSFTDFGNKDVMGHAYSVFPTLERKKILKNNFDFTFEIGAGVAYFDHPYSAISNPENIVIGSDFTAIIAGGASLQKRIGQFGVKVGGAFRHFSNGHYKVPNVGANVFSIDVGARYYFSDKVEVNEFESLGLDKGLKYYTYAGFGMHEVEGTILPAGGPKYPVYFTAFGLKKRISYKIRLLVELNYNYFTDYHDMILNGQLYEDKVNLRSSKVVLFVGHELIFNRVSLSIKAGANMFYPIRKKLVEVRYLDNRVMDQYFTGEFALNYHLFDSMSSKKWNPFIGIGIRTIGGKADFFLSKVGVMF